MTINDGRDDYNLRGIPWTISLDVMPNEVRELVRSAEVANTRVTDWKKFQEEYPETVLNDRVKYATILAAAVPMTVVWFVGWLLALAVWHFAGYGWVFAAWFLSTVMVFMGLMVGNSFRFRRWVNPLDLALQESVKHLVAYQILLFFFPVIFVWAGWLGLDALVAQPDVHPTEDVMQAMRVTRDTRARVAVAMAAGIRTCNSLAQQLKRETDFRLVNGEPKAGETALDVDKTRELLRGIRENVLRQQEFLWATHGDAVLGEYCEDDTDLIIANADRISQASGILADSRVRGAALVELASALSGDARSMVRRH